MTAETMLTGAAVAVVVVMVLGYILGKLLKGVLVAVILGAVALSIFPNLKTSNVASQIASASEEYQFGVEKFMDCRGLGVFESNLVSACEKMAIDEATKQHGKEYAEKAREGLHALIQKLELK